MSVIANVALCGAKAPFKPVKLTGDCNRIVAESVHVNGEDGGAGAFMACQHANLVAGLGVFENKQIHKGPSRSRGCKRTLTSSPSISATCMPVDAQLHKHGPPPAPIAVTAG